jgi:predicted regulator of Ras-like GTPase activity (Roadblock/LC7/MglB family)
MNLNLDARESLKALIASPYILASAFLLRDGAVLNYELSSKCSATNALELMHYANRLAVEKLKNGSIDEVVIAKEDCKIAVSWVNSRVLLAVVAKPMVDTNLLLNEIKQAGKQAAKLMLEPKKELNLEKATRTHRIACLQLTIRDSNGLSIPNCLIEIYKEKRKIQAELTPRSGLISLKLLTDEYTIVVRKEGYASYNAKLLMDREFMVQEITLKKLGE